MHPDSTKSYKSKPTVIDPNLSKMTKEQILKLSDSEISRYTKNSKKLSKSHHGYMPFMPDGFASPIASIQNMSNARKMNLQNHATRLAAELFSYYIKPQQGKPKKYSVSYKNSEASFFQNRKRRMCGRPLFERIAQTRGHTSGRERRHLSGLTGSERFIAQFMADADEPLHTG